MRHFGKHIIVLLILALGISLAGCGVYGFRGKNPPKGISSISVPFFENVSGFAEANIQENFTETLKNKIISDNTFRISAKENADGLLTCTILTVNDEPLVISGNENVAKRKITINVNVDFQDLNKQKKIWDRQFSNWGEYNSSSAGFSNRDAGINEAIEKITEDILNDLTSNW